MSFWSWDNVRFSLSWLSRYTIILQTSSIDLQKQIQFYLLLQEISFLENKVKTESLGLNYQYSLIVT